MKESGKCRPKQFVIYKFGNFIKEPMSLIYCYCQTLYRYQIEDNIVRLMNNKKGITMFISLSDFREHWVIIEKE